MTFQKRTPTPAATHSLGDVLEWAKASGESYDAIRELAKVPTRMGMADNDIGLIPADLPHFENVVAPTAYGVVARRSKDPEAARRTANSRVRTLLRRFHATQEGRQLRAGAETRLRPRDRGREGARRIRRQGGRVRAGETQVPLRAQSALRHGSPSADPGRTRSRDDRGDRPQAEVSPQGDLASQ